MPRYHRRRSYRGSRDKYSVEQTAINVSLSDPATTVSSVVVPPSDIQGMRKVKHLMIHMQSGSTSFDGVWWALVYVPAGTTPSVLNITTGQPLYEPNQFVLNCGVFDFTSGPVRVSTPLSRNLNSGDAIVLLTRQATTSTTAQNIHCVVRYAITLQ